MLKETKYQKKLTLNQHPFLNNYGKITFQTFNKKLTFLRLTKWKL